MFPYLYRVNLFNEIISIPHVYFLRQIISLFRETSKCSLIIGCGNASISIQDVKDGFSLRLHSGLKVLVLILKIPSFQLATVATKYKKRGVNYLGRVTNVKQIKKYLWTLGKMLWTREKIFSCERSGPRSISRWLLQINAASLRLQFEKRHCGLDYGLCRAVVFH